MSLEELIAQWNLEVETNKPTLQTAYTIVATALVHARGIKHFTWMEIQAALTMLSQAIPQEEVTQQ